MARDRTGGARVDVFFIWLLILLAPSLAAIGWFAWYSGLLDRFGADRQSR